jgi:hypothetical protein
MSLISSGGFNQSVEDALLNRIGSGEVFGMPLDGNEPGMIRHFQRLDGAIGGKGDRL